MKRLVVTADDFGLTDGVCAGIVRAIEGGIVTATSVMVCVPGVEERVCPWRKRIAGRAGLHLQLTEGRPCADPAEVPSLVDSEGKFRSSFADLRSLDPYDIEREWDAQLERLRSMGIEPTHLDTHHHVHRNASVFESYMRIAVKHRLPVRTGSRVVTSQLRKAGVRSADYCEAGWFGGDLSPAGFAALARSAFALLRDAGTVEIVCHPAYPDAELSERSRYTTERLVELETLTSAEVGQLLRDAGISLTKNELLGT